MRLPCSVSTTSSYFVAAFSLRTGHIRLPVLTMRTSNTVILGDDQILISLYSIPPNLSREVVTVKDLVIPEKVSVTCVLVLFLTQRTKWMPNGSVVLPRSSYHPQAAQFSAVRWSSCIIAVMGINIRVCMGIFWSLLPYLPLPYLYSASLDVWSITLPKQGLASFCVSRKTRKR